MKIKLHELPKLASCRFNYENSALRAREYPPAYIRLDNGEFRITHSSPFTPIGWTDQPPFHTKWDGKENVIAVMFEDREFNLIWCHYRSGPQGDSKMTGKVLIIEDDAMLPELASEVFERANYLCTLVADGWEALDLITKDNYDVIITDIKHPGPDGIEIIRHSRQLVPETPVVVLSGYPNVEYSDECLRSGAFAYLEKPTSSQDIVDTIKKAISGGAVVPIDALSNEGRLARYRAVIASGNLGDHNSLSDLTMALIDKNDPILRGLAATALGEIGNPAGIPVLTAALSDENRDVRIFTALALCKIGDPAAVPALMTALTDKHWAVRKKAASALGKIGDPASVPAFIEALSDEDWSVRLSAAEALSTIGDPVAVPALIGALSDQNNDVRRSVMESLCEIGPPAVSGLTEALSDEDWSVRLSAAEALGTIGDPIAVPALTEALSDQRKSVCYGAALALRNIGDPAAVGTLMVALNNEKRFVRYCAVEALGGIEDLHDHSAVPLLIGALKEEHLGDARRSAAMGLGKLRNSDAVPALMEALSHHDPILRRRTADALGQIGDPAAVHALTVALSDRTEYVRKAAALALGEIGDPVEKPALMAALSDEDDEVRQYVTEALSRIGNRARQARTEPQV